MKKINGKAFLVIVFWLLVIGSLVYSRFINLGWGLPYQMHPDEWQNMILAIQQMKCPSFSQIIECLNPHIFVYGSFSLYISNIIIYLTRFVTKSFTQYITISEAAMSLRVISATASIINVFVLIKIIEKISNIPSASLRASKNQKLLIILIATFSPFFIQYSHFGTTESLLMLFYSLIVYHSLKLLTVKQWDNKTVILLSLFSGLAMATKISSVIFLFVPLAVIIFKNLTRPHSTRYKIIWRLFFYGAGFLGLGVIFGLVFSPHNLISYQKFIGALRYESAVALGRIVVFYTRQFIETTPIWFQLTKVFPYVLGWPVFLLGGLGFLGGLGWKDKRINLLRFSFLVYFLPNSFLFAKWTRFMAPIFPLMTVFATVFLLRIKVINIIKIIIVIIAILPGLAYLSIYQNLDVRFKASEWIYQNIPAGSRILSETANGIDVPVGYPDLKYPISKYDLNAFNLYEVDGNQELQQELFIQVNKADYIFVPSRRVFMNHTCFTDYQLSVINDQTKRCENLKKMYPVVNEYYSKLLSGELGFKQIAEITSYPKISIFGKTILEFPDEAAEETWTVFDHPVIKIYKRIKS